MDGSFDEIILVSGVATARDSNGGTINCLVGGGAGEGRVSPPTTGIILRYDVPGTGMCISADDRARMQQTVVVTSRVFPVWVWT